jgi:hypothetical protein
MTERKTSEGVRPSAARIATLAAVLLCVTGFGSTGCSGADGSLPADAIRLPTSDWHPGDASMTALARGRVQGSDSGAGTCVWLESDTDPAAKLPVVWPAGFYARLDPLRIYDGGGGIVAREGQVVEFGGGLGAVPGPACMFGRSNAFFVQSDVDVVGAS